MGWIITLLVLLLIASVPLGANVKYSSDGITVRLIASVIRFTIIPFPKRKKGNTTASTLEKESTVKKKKSKSAPKKADTKPQTPKGGSLLDFLPLVQVGLRFLNSFRKKLRVNKLELKLIMAGDDPCDLAVNYGRAWAVMDNLLPALERVFVIQKRDIEVECDFCADQTTIYAQMDITITIGRLIGMTCKYGFQAIRELLTLKKKRKGGAAA